MVRALNGINISINFKLRVAFLIILLLCTFSCLVTRAKLTKSIDYLDQVIRVNDAIVRIALETRYNLMVTSDAVRGIIINPADIAEKQRKLDADKAYYNNLAETRKLFSEASNTAGD